MSLYRELKELYQEVLYPNEDKIEDLILKMNSSEVRKEFEKFLASDSLSNDDREILGLLLRCTQFIYELSGGQTGISDTEYDKLLDKFTSYGGKIEITVPVIGKNKKIVQHTYTSLRGTLDKVYALTEEDKLENKSRKTLDDWIKSSENKIYEKTGEHIDLNDEEVYCFPKFDGVSAIFHFSKDGKLEKVLTRGYTVTNEAVDITHIFRGWVEGPFDNAPFPYGMKTEIMMSNDDFERYNREHHTDYKQSRSIVSSIINSDVVDDRIEYLKIMPLRLSHLEEDGTESLQILAPGVFDTPYLRCKLSDREKMREFAFENKFVNGLRTDGMVIYLIDETIQELLGREHEKQKFEVAFKFTEEVGYSKIKDIKFTTGLFGRVNPVAYIKPIELKGNKIEKVSLGSYGRFKSLKLAKDDRVKVLYDIIPYITFDKSDGKCKRSGNEPIKSPDFCEDCGEPLTVSDSGDLLYCTNKKCPCKQKGKILNFLRKMHIDEISYATIDLFYEEGYLKSIKDIYKLKDHKKELEKLPGFGKKSIKIILDEIDSHREVTSSQLLGSLGIEGISVRVFNKVSQMLSFDEILEYCLNDETEAINVLSVIPGIKSKTAKKIISGIKENEKLIEFLEEELNVIEDKKSSDYFYTVVFTKVRDRDLEDFIEKHDGKVEGSVKKDSSLLVVPTIGIQSAKVEKAKKYEIPIVSIDEAREYIISHFLK